MSKIKQGTEDEWRAFGRAVKGLRDQFQSVGIENQGLLPTKLMDYYFNIINKIDKFRAKAEDEMFRRGGPQDIKVWYPDD